jgi:hypothetical protein
VKTPRRLTNALFAIGIVLSLPGFASNAKAEFDAAQFREMNKGEPVDCYPAVRSSDMLIDLVGKWRHHCGVPNRVVAAFLFANSMDRYYESEVKGQCNCRSRGR